MAIKDKYEPGWREAARDLEAKKKAEKQQQLSLEDKSEKTGEENGVII